MSNRIPEFIWPNGPAPTVQPFTYKDGLSYLDRLDLVVRYMNRSIVTFVNDNVGGVTDTFTVEVNRLIGEVNDALDAQKTEVDTNLATQNAEVDAKITALETYVNEQVALIIGDSVSIQDSIVATLIADPASLARIAGDLVWADKDIEAVVTALNTLTSVGRLSAATLDSRFEATVDDATYGAFVTAVGDALANKASKATEDTVSTGRLSATVMDQRFAASQDFILVGKYGGGPISSKFDFLRDGVINPSQDTRVVVLGSSNANAHQSTEYVSQTYKACYQRLSNRANGGNQKSLAAVAGTPSPSGMSWWNGAIGNTTSANYFTPSLRTALAYVQPRYVIHQIGENDYFYGTTIADYKANLKNALEFVESSSPNSINILVFGYGRTDVPSPVASWAAYGQAMAELVNELPTRRYFINASRFFESLGTMSTDQGAVLHDTVHLNDNGNRLAANLIGAHLGIPSESDRVAVNSFDFPMPSAVQTFTGTAVVLAEVWFDSANYPREVDVLGAFWASWSNANAYYSVAVIDNSNVARDTYGYANNGSPAAKSQPVNASLNIPPGVAGRVSIRLYCESGNCVVQPGTAGLSRAKAVFRPI